MGAGALIQGDRCLVALARGAGAVGELVPLVEHLASLAEEDIVRTISKNGSTKEVFGCQGCGFCAHDPRVACRVNENCFVGEDRGGACFEYDAGQWRPRKCTPNELLHGSACNQPELWADHWWSGRLDDDALPLSTLCLATVDEHSF